MTALQNLRDDLERIEQRARVIDPLRKHWEGRPDTAFMAKSARDALDHRLGRLSINFPRLLVTSYVDRMTLTGWTAEDGSADEVAWARRSEEHTSELQSRGHLVCRLLLEKKKTET